MKFSRIKLIFPRGALIVMLGSLFLLSLPSDSMAMDPGCKDPNASEVTVTISPATGSASTPITIAVSFRWTVNAPQQCLDQNLIFDFGYYNFDTSPMSITIEEVSVKSNGQNIVSKSITRTPVAFNLKGNTSFTIGAAIENGWNGPLGRLGYGVDVVAFKGARFTLDKPVALINACIADDDRYSCNTSDPSCAGKSTIKIDVSLCGRLSKIWACVAGNSKYACSPGNKSDLSDTLDPGGNNFCSGKTPVQIQEFLCGSNVNIPPGGGGGVGGGGGASGTASKSYLFNITNPLDGGPNDLFDIIDIVTKWILYISVPLAVLFIMYAGFLMLTAGPVPANFQKGREILKYTVIGLAIIFIGKGFVTLIISVIELGGDSPTTSQTQAGDMGWTCARDNDCNTGLKCNNTMCASPFGNLEGGPCLNSQCGPGLACDNTAPAQKVINGRTVGTCFKILCQPTSAGATTKACISGPKTGQVCFSTRDCQ